MSVINKRGHLYFNPLLILLNVRECVCARALVHECMWHYYWGLLLIYFSCCCCLQYTNRNEYEDDTDIGE